jgi:transposase
MSRTGIPQTSRPQDTDSAAFAQAYKAKHPSVSGHQGRYALREIVNAIFYQNRTGCQWRICRMTLRVPKPRPSRSSGMVVSVKEPVEPIVSADSGTCHRNREPIPRDQIFHDQDWQGFGTTAANLVPASAGVLHRAAGTAGSAAPIGDGFSHAA